MALTLGLSACGSDTLIGKNINQVKGAKRVNPFMYDISEKDFGDELWHQGYRFIAMVNLDGVTKHLMATMPINVKKNKLGVSKMHYQRAFKDLTEGRDYKVGKQCHSMKNPDRQIIMDGLCYAFKYTSERIDIMKSELD